MIPVKDFLSSAFNDFFQPATEPLLDAKEVSCRAWRATVLCPFDFLCVCGQLIDDDDTYLHVRARAGTAKSSVSVRPERKRPTLLAPPLMSRYPLGWP
jgi:hypothetical protein